MWVFSFCDLFHERDIITLWQPINLHFFYKSTRIEDWIQLTHWKTIFSSLLQKAEREREGLQYSATAKSSAATIARGEERSRLLLPPQDTAKCICNLIQREYSIRKGESRGNLATRHSSETQRQVKQQSLMHHCTCFTGPMKWRVTLTVRDGKKGDETFSSFLFLHLVFSVSS